MRRPGFVRLHAPASDIGDIQINPGQRISSWKPSSFRAPSSDIGDIQINPGLGAAQLPAYLSRPLDRLACFLPTRCLSLGFRRELFVDSRIDGPAIGVSFAAMRANRPQPTCRFQFSGCLKPGCPFRETPQPGTCAVDSSLVNFR
jgi:hypothetical protein